MTVVVVRTGGQDSEDGGFSGVSREALTVPTAMTGSPGLVEEPSPPLDTVTVLSSLTVGGTETTVPPTVGDTEGTVITVVNAPLPESPTAAALLAASRARYPGVDDRVLTGRRSPFDWPDYGMGVRQTLTPHLGPGRTGVVLGSLEEPVPMTGPGGRLALMPTDGVRGPEPGARISQKILKGERLYQQIMRGDPPPNTKKNAALVMWYLQALASKKASLSSGQPNGSTVFREGALTVEDPDHRLEGWLKSFNVYPRSSSHLDEYQRVPGCEPYGLDLRGVEMPNERRTVLLARLPSTREAPGGPNLGERSLLYLKMEPHGCRGLSFQGTGSKTGVWQGIKRFFANLGDFFGHAGGWFTSIRQRGGGLDVVGQNNRERVDAALLAPYETVLQGVRRWADPEAYPSSCAPYMEKMLTGVAAILDDPARLGKTGGIHLTLDRLEQAGIALRYYQDAVARAGLNAVLNLGPPVGEVICPRELKDAVQQQTTRLLQTLEQAETRLRAFGDHPELRFGREVILTRDEMGIGQCQSVGRLGDGPIQGTGRMSVRSQELTLAGFQYIQADLARQRGEYLKQFDLDVERSTYTVGNQGYYQAQIRPGGGSVVGDAFDQLVRDAGDPPDLAAFLKCMAHQGLTASLETALLAHVQVTAGHIVGTSTFGGSSQFSLTRTDSDPPGQHIYRLSYTMDSRETGEGGVREISNGSFVDMDQSYLRSEVSLLVTYDPVTSAVTLNYDGAPSFEYRLVPAPAPAPAPAPPETAPVPRPTV